MMSLNKEAWHSSWDVMFLFRLSPSELQEILNLHLQILHTRRRMNLA